MSQTQTITEYLSSLKAGDSIYRQARGTNLDRGRVSRVTKTQIILVTGGRYRITDGQSIGGSTFERTNIVLPTPEIKRLWGEIYLSRWAVKGLPETFKSLTTEQQLEVYRHINAIAAANKTAAAEPATADEL